MPKLIFSVPVNNESGVNFNTRYGASLTIYPGQVLDYAIREGDEMPLDEHIRFYTSRYARYGLRVTCDTVVLPKLQDLDKIIPDLSTLDNGKTEEKTPESEEETPKDNDLDEENNKNPEGIEPVSEDSKKEMKDIEALSYNELRELAESLEIPLEGREAKVSIKEKIISKLGE